MSQAAPVTSIQPILQNALGSLELDLEAELRRYRRHRAADGVSRGLSQTTIAEHLSEPWQDNVTPVAAVDVESVDSAAARGFESVSLPTPENPASRSAEVSRVLEMLQRPGGDGATDNLLNLDHSEVLPDDYLESSEELLKSLGNDASVSSVPSQSKTPRRSKRWWLVAGGVAVAGVAMVVTVVNVVGAGRADSDAGQTVATQVGGDSSGTVEPTPAPKTINLASEEFVDLSLDNLSVVNPKEQEAIASTTPPPTTKPAPNNAVADPLAPPSGREDLASALLPPSLRPQPLSSFPVTPQIAAAQASNAGTMVTPDGLKVGFYYVIFKNTTPKSLGKAREEVPAAFVRTFPVGRAIQMAEVATQTQADALVKKLNDAKIAAEIYHHQLTPAP